MESETTAFRPKGFWQLIGASIKAYFSDIAVYITIAAIAIVPVALCSGGLWAIGDYTITAADGWSSNLAKWMVTDLLWPAGTIVLTLLTYPLMHGALIHATAQKHLVRTIDIGQSYAAAFRKAGRLIGSWLVVILLLAAMMVSLICLVLAVRQDAAWLYVLAAVLAAGLPFALYVSLKWLFVLQTVMLEGHRITETIPRSSDLSRGNWWRTFGTWVLLGLAIPLALAAAISVPLFFMRRETGTLLGDVILSGIFPGLLLIPLSVIWPTLLYFDLRTRKEQYAPAAIAAELGQGPAATPAAPAPEPTPQAETAHPGHSRSLNPLFIVAAVAVLLAALVPPAVLLLPEHADRGDIQVSTRRASTGTQARVNTHDGLRTIDFTDFAFVVDFNGHVEAGYEPQSVVCDVMWWEEEWTRCTAMVQVYAMKGTMPREPYEYLPAPEHDPANEVTVFVEPLDDERILVSPVSGEFPSGSQVVIILDFGGGSGWCARLFTA